MTLPANVRFNTQVPFPAMVTAIGPVTLTKVNGVWTVGFSIANLGTEVPGLGSFPNDYLLVWDSVQLNFFKTPITTLQQMLVGAGRTQRSITGSGQLPIVANDSILNLNAASDLTPTVPLASGRTGAPLTFKNLPGSHLQTLTPTSPDTFDGQSTYPLGAGASVTLVPYNDGVNAGYAIE